MPDRDEEERLANLVWRAKADYYLLGGSEEARAEALRVWDAIFDEYARNSHALDELADKVGLSPLSGYLCLIYPELERARDAKTGEIKKPKQAKGRPKDSFGKPFDTAQVVNALRANDNKTFEEACPAAAKSLGMKEGAVKEHYTRYKRGMLHLARKRLIGTLRRRPNQIENS
jgi:hypothetical protein